MHSIAFNCSDDISSVAECATPTTVTAEGADQSVAGSVTDLAGNSASTDILISLDKTPPVLTSIVTPPANAAGWHGVDVAIAYDCSDSLSG